MSGLAPQPTVPSTPPTYAAPSHQNFAAVAATVAVVGFLMAVLVVWLVFRLRRASNSQPILGSRRPSSYPFRPSFAPSEASSKFGFIRKPLHLSHRPKDPSWDFADPDPFAHPKEASLDAPLSPTSQKHRPTPLPPVPAYTPRAQRASTYKDDVAPRTPTTPATPDFIDPPPPAYCRESASWPVSHSKDSPPT